MGRTGGHQRGDSVAAYGEVFMATVSGAAEVVEHHRRQGLALAHREPHQ